MNKDILMLVHNNTHSTSRIFRNIELIRKTEVSDEVDIRISRIETACIECREQVDALYEIFKTLYTEEQVMEGMLQISEYYADNFGKDIDGHKKALEIIQSLKQPKQ